MAGPAKLKVTYKGKYFPPFIANPCQTEPANEFTAFETRLLTALCINARSSSAITGSAAETVVSEMPASAADAS